MIVPSPLQSTISDTRASRLITVLMVLTANVELPTYKKGTPK